MSLTDYRDDELGLLNNAFLSIARSLRRESHTPSFFFGLHPQRWGIRLYGFEDVGDDAGAERLQAEVEAFEASPGPRELHNLDALVAHVHAAREGWGMTPADLSRAAIALLMRRLIVLGWHGIDAPEGNRSQTWFRPDRPTSTTLKGFQVALEYAAHGRFMASRAATASRSIRREAQLGEIVFHGQYSEAGEERRPVLELTHFMNRRDIFNSHSISVFLAEHLYATGGRAGVCKPRDHSLSFLPLAGLGQWRASIAWITNAPRAIGETVKLATPSLQESFQELFSLALIDCFGINLSQAILVEGPTAVVPLRKLVTAFAVLWWAEEICVYRTGRPVFRLGRNSDGDLARELPLSDPALPRGGLLSVEPLDENCDRTRVWLDLRHLPGIPADTVVDVFGFDAVAYDVRLFDASTDLPSIASSLGVRIGEIVKMHHAQRQIGRAQRHAERAAIVEGVGHNMKNTVKAIGWRNAIRLLQQLPKSPDATVREILTEAECSLSLFVLVEGMGGILRLGSLCEQNEFGKLARWTSPAALARWQSGDPGVFKKYVDFLTEFTATLLYSSLKRDGFTLEVKTGGRWRRTVVRTDRPPGGVIDDWVRDHGALPPFLADRDADSHVALLGALIEPIFNAIKVVLEYFPSTAPGRIVLRVENQLPDRVRVTVGNETRHAPEQTPQGILLTRKLMHMTQLGNIGDPSVTAGKDGRRKTYWVPIDLEPHRLARLILDAVSRK